MAECTVKLPLRLVELIGGTARTTVCARTVRDALDALARERPEIQQHLFDEGGRLRQYVLCFRNGEDTRREQGLETELADGDTLTILQSVSGG